jgi:hypothetical protein
MIKLFGTFTITNDVTSPLYKLGDKAFGAYFYRKLVPNATVFVRTDDFEAIHTIASVDRDQIWFGDPANEQPIGPYDKSSVKAVMLLRYRPRSKR